MNEMALTQHVDALAQDSFKGRKTGTVYVHQTNAWFDEGYFQIFDNNRTATSEHLQRLREDMWIDKGTRFFIIDLVAYCSNTGQFAQMQFRADMRVTGELVPTVQVDVFCTSAPVSRLTVLFQRQLYQTLYLAHRLNPPCMHTF